MSFKDYKKNRITSLDDVVKQAEAVNTQTKSFEADPLDWYPTTDKAGNAQIVLRFLPALETESEPFVRWWAHAFQNETTGMWYIDNCLSTLDPNFSGKYDDPVMLYNQKLYKKAGKDAPDTNPYKMQASKQKRNINFRSNVYIIADSHKPDCNGTQKKWKYGQGVFNEIMKAMKPPKIEGAIEPDEPINPFDLIEGANLRITISNDPTKKQSGGKAVRKYEFKWLRPGPLGSDEMMEGVWNELNSDDDKGVKKWSLAKYVAADQFKTFEALHQRLVKVMGFDPLAEDAKPAQRAPQAAPRAQQSAVVEDTPPWDETPSAPAVEAPKGESDDWFAQLESNA